MELIFNWDISRSTSREDWKMIWRHQRILTRQLKKAADLAVANLIMFGDAWPEHRRADEIDKLVNPPIVIYPEPKQWT